MMRVLVLSPRKRASTALEYMLLNKQQMEYCHLFGTMESETKDLNTNTRKASKQQPS